MEWKDVGNVVAKIAPFAEGLLSTLGGPVGIISAVGIKALTTAFGLPENTQPDVLAQAINVDPQAALKLKQAELDFQLQMRTQDNEELKARLLDVQSARERQGAHEKVTGQADTNLYVLSWFIVLGFFCLVAFLLFVKIPIDQSSVLFMLFGALSSGFMLVLQYFYGSNKSSENKTNMIYNSTPNMPKKDV